MTLRSKKPKKDSSFPTYKRVARNWQERMLFLLGWKGVGLSLLHHSRYGKNIQPKNLQQAWETEIAHLQFWKNNEQPISP